MNDKIISYLTLRKLIGYLGLVLAPLCLIGGLLFAGITQESISAYYNSNMRDIFVGVLTVVGAFLLTYKGYDLKDNIITSIAGTASLGIALFPMASNTALFGVFQLVPAVSTVLHFISTGIFFLSMAYMSYFQFTQNVMKERHNLIYQIGGVSLLSLIVILVIGNQFSIPFFTIIIEAIMLTIFGLIWLIKGKAIYRIEE